MNGVLRGLPVPGLLGAVAAVLLTGTTAVPGAAAPLTLRYTCSFALIAPQPMTATLTWDASDAHVVGQATPPLPVNASATTGEFITRVLTTAGARTVSGTADADAVVTAPGGDTGVTTELTVPTTAVPASGPMTFAAHGTARSMVFDQPGDARITVGVLVLRMTPRDAHGDPTPLGEVSATCEPDPGQDTVLARFRVLPAATTTRPPATPPRPTAAPPRPTATPPAPGAPTGPDGSGRATGTVARVGPAPGTPAAPGTAATTTGTSASAPSSPLPGAPSTTRAGVRATAAGVVDPAPDPDLARLLLVAVGVPAAGVVACGCVWWSRRRAGGRPR